MCLAVRDDEDVRRGWWRADGRLDSTILSPGVVSECNLMEGWRKHWNGTLILAQEDSQREMVHAAHRTTVRLIELAC